MRKNKKKAMYSCKEGQAKKVLLIINVSALILVASN